MVQKVWIDLDVAAAGETPGHHLSIQHGNVRPHGMRYQNVPQYSAHSRRLGALFTPVKTRHWR